MLGDLGLDFVNRDPALVGAKHVGEHFFHEGDVDRPAGLTVGELLAERDVAALYRVQSAGKVRMSVHPEPHDGLGLACYAWMSSPLRRYADLVNQWQLAAALGGVQSMALSCFDEAIANYVRKKYNVMIGDRTAEEVKMQIGTALPLERELTMEVRGRDLIAGLPRTIPITSSEVMEAIELPLQQLVAAVRHVLEQTPPELSSDIIDKGMVMSGGGALLRNIDKLLTQVTGVPCHVAENSLDCVALGTGLALEHFDFFKKSLVQQI